MATKIIDMSKTVKPAMLSEHFSLREFTQSDTAERAGIPNIPDGFSFQKLVQTAKLLEEVRKLLGGLPIRVSSGYRGYELNVLTGGSKTSQHMLGEAVDFTCERFGSPLAICKKIVASGIKFGQLIWEGSWVHISVPSATNNMEVMTAKFIKVNGKTKAVYTQGLPA